jgi:hypothetical protein
MKDAAFQRTAAKVKSRARYITLLVVSLMNSRGGIAFLISFMDQFRGVNASLDGLVERLSGRAEASIIVE